MSSAARGPDSPGPHFPLSLIPLPPTPPELQKPEEGAQVDLVKNVFWRTIEQQLGLKEGVNSQEHVKGYYKVVVAVALKTLDPAGDKIPRNDDVFAQCFLIEQYLIKNPPNPHTAAALLHDAANAHLYPFLLWLGETYGKRGVFQDEKNSKLLPLLVLLCPDRHPEVIRQFLKFGAFKGQDAVLAAAKRGKPHILKALLDADVPISDHALKAAVEKGSLECVALLLRHNAPVDDWDKLILLAAEKPGEPGKPAKRGIATMLRQARAERNPPPPELPPASP